MQENGSELWGERDVSGGGKPEWCGSSVSERAHARARGPGVEPWPHTPTRAMLKITVSASQVCGGEACSVLRAEPGAHVASAH